MEQVEQSQQPLKPEAVWQHHQPVSTDGPPAVDPSASASSAFSPAQIPYTDSNTLALLQSWYAYYAQQHRALQTAQAQTGNPEGAFHPPGPSDPALAGTAAHSGALARFIAPCRGTALRGCIGTRYRLHLQRTITLFAYAATLPHILSSLAPRPDGSAADAITHATPGSAGPGPPLPLVSSGVSPPVQGLAHANGLLRRPSAVDSLEQTAGVRYFPACTMTPHRPSAKWPSPALSSSPPLRFFKSAQSVSALPSAS